METALDPLHAVPTLEAAQLNVRSPFAILGPFVGTKSETADKVIEAVPKLDVRTLKLMGREAAYPENAAAVGRSDVVPAMAVILIDGDKVTFTV